MRYCLDTSALINLGERHYPEHLSLFAPIWSHLYEQIKSKNIVSVDYVKIELEKRAGEWREQFIAHASDMFLISDKVERQFASVVRAIEGKPRTFLQNKQRDRFMSGADPWIIALAQSYGKDATVISGETKKLADYGLGAVCKELGVRHIDLIRFFEENKVGA